MKKKDHFKKKGWKRTWNMDAHGSKHKWLFVFTVWKVIFNDCLAHQNKQEKNSFNDLKLRTNV